jgi:hypothetical protein
MGLERLDRCRIEQTMVGGSRIGRSTSMMIEAALHHAFVTRTAESHRRSRDPLEGQHEHQGPEQDGTHHSLHRRSLFDWF